MNKRLKKPIVLPAGGASQANIDKALEQQSDYLRNVVQKSVAGLDLESNHAVTLTANGTTEVNPAEGKDGMEKTTVTVAVPLEANKSVTIDASGYSGAVEVTPTSGNTAMKKATVTVSNLPVLEANKTDTIDVSAYSEPVEITPSANKDAMEKTTVTLSNIPQIESNKASEIDVSTYTEPVEIEPTSGKDGMAKTTVTLTNIPSSDKTLYCFVNETDSLTVYAFSATPSVEDDVVTISNGAISVVTEGVTAVEDDTITVDSKVYARNSDGDITL